MLILCNLAQIYLFQSEQVARNHIDTHLSLILAPDRVGFEILEIWLSRLDARHQAVEVRCGHRSHTNRTYISGRTDYLVSAITIQDQDKKQDFLVQDPRVKTPTLDELQLTDCMLFLDFGIFSNHSAS